jgi:23S rRNA pseudouridine1911/1915/1917 synthase
MPDIGVDDEPDGPDGTRALRFVVAEDDADRRLDVVTTAASAALGAPLSRTRIKALVEDGRVFVDGVPARDANQKLRSGQAVSLDLPAPVEPEPRGEAMALAIVHEDAHIIVVDKPAGLVVHPAPGHASGTLVNALIAHCGASLSGIGGVKRPGIVHRLDKETSGLLAVAKTDAAHRGFSILFADHGRTLSLRRAYKALVWGKPERLFGTVDAPLGRHPTDRQRMAVVPEARGREAITHWRLEESFGPDPRAPVASLVTCQLETGRTHQIRVHMAHIKHPVLGDPLYAKGFRGKASLLSPEARALLEGLNRQALHAAVLGFDHPVTGEPLEFESPPPPDLAALLAALRG